MIRLLSLLLLLLTSSTALADVQVLLSLGRTAYQKCGTTLGVVKMAPRSVAPQ